MMIPPKIETVFFGDNTLMNFEELHVPLNVQNIIEILQDNGFLYSDRNILRFVDNPPWDSSVPRYDYGDIQIRVEEKNYNNLCFRVDLETDLVVTDNSFLRDYFWRGDIQFEKFGETLHRPFSRYKFTPENDWGHMRYINFLTADFHYFSHSWSEDEIRAIDKLITKGIAPHFLGELLIALRMDMEVLKENADDPNFASVLKLPLDWVKKTLQL